MTDYILKTVRSDMTAHNVFVWPREGHVMAPDWNPKPVCGGGLHGFLNGEGDGNLADWSPDAVWIVARVEHWVDLGGKVKVPEAWVEYAGTRIDATNYLQSKGCKGAIIGGTATAGDYGTATAGEWGTAIAGYGGTATAGHRGTAISGKWGTATAGDYGTAIAGYGGTATAGHRGTASAGKWGAIAIRHFANGRSRILVGYVGEDGIKPDTPYKVEDGKFVEVKK